MGENMDEGNAGLWHQVFAEGHPLLAGKQRRYGMLPGAPRCRLCYAPFGGAGGWIMRVRGLHVSERNPNFCNLCDKFLHAFPGGAEVSMSMMLVDIRGSVALSDRMSSADYARVVVETRRELHGIFERTDAFVLEYQGDSVFAVWPPGFVGPGHATQALEAADLLVGLAKQRPGRAAELGAGVHSGPIFIGTVPDAGGRMRGIGVFGLNVNVLGRLSHAAGPGEVLVSREAYAAAHREPPEGALEPRPVKGLDAPIAAVTLRAEPEMG